MDLTQVFRRLYTVSVTTCEVYPWMYFVHNSECTWTVENHPLLSRPIAMAFSTVQIVTY